MEETAFFIREKVKSYNKRLNIGVLFDTIVRLGSRKGEENEP